MSTRPQRLSDNLLLLSSPSCILEDVFMSVFSLLLDFTQENEGEASITVISYPVSQAGSTSHTPWHCMESMRLSLSLPPVRGSWLLLLDWEPGLSWWCVVIQKERRNVFRRIHSIGYNQTEDRNPKWETQGPELSSETSIYYCQTSPLRSSCALAKCGVDGGGGDGGGDIYHLPCVYISMVFRTGFHLGHVLLEDPSVKSWLSFFSCVILGESFNFLLSDYTYTKWE